MEQIEHSLLQSDPQGGRKIHVLHSLGGIGIQQLTVDLTRHGQEAAEKAVAVLRWLALRSNRQWLIVFDNVDRDYYAEAEDP